MGSILAALRTTNEQDAEQLKQAVAAQDLNAVIHAAHRLLGAGKMLGAKAFTAACQDLEEGGRAGDWSAVGRALPEFDTQWLRLKGYLDGSDPVSA